MSTAQVAKALGLSVTTVKRWVDDGILPAHRTAGGHRKLLMADVLRVTRESGLMTPDVAHLLAPVSRRDSPDPETLRRRLQDAAARVDEGQIRGVLHAARHHQIPMETIADEILGPAMTFVGTEWAAGRIDVATEHRITQLVLAVACEWSGSTREKSAANRPVAVGGATEFDSTMLPSLLAKVTLDELGWDAVNLGPHTPVSAFVAAMDRLRPKLLWVSVTHLPSPEQFEVDYRALYQAAQTRRIAVALGGRALTAQQRSRLPYTSFGDGMGHLAAFARTLHPLAERPRRGRPPKN